MSSLFHPSCYRFASSLVTSADPARVHALLVDLEHYPDWWPQVRAVASLGPDDALVVCRSALPYDLELHLHAVSRDPRLLEVRLDGALQGFARWQLHPLTGGTRLDFEQQVTVTGRLAWASYLFRPMLRWNHAVMMHGLEGGIGRALSSSADPG